SNDRTTTDGNQTVGSTSTTTQAPIANTTAPVVEVMGYNKGYVSGNAYYNDWAELSFSFREGYVLGTDEEYASFEDGKTECGLYISYANESGIPDTVVIAFEKASVTAEEYINALTTQLKSEYAASGLNADFGIVLEIGLANKYWQSVDVTLADGLLYQNYMVTVQDGYIICMITQSSDELMVNRLVKDLSVHF
ncbi:MAG: hypothetical protein IKW66_00660, partial [Clostridia bacterium]|nr:hypothetical protein [Clostridia bacterium]